MSTTSPFFRLPRELRNRIYHFALLNARPSFSQSTADVFVSYLQTDSVEEYQYSEKLRWLLASRQVLSEGLEQFYRYATLDNCYVSWDLEGQHHNLTLDGKTSIFELGRLRAAKLDVRMGKTHVEIDDNLWYDAIVPRGKERFKYNDEDFGALGKAIAKLEACGLRELELSVHLFRAYDRSADWESSGNRFLVDLGGASGGDSEGEDGDGDEEYDSDLNSEDSYDELYWNVYGTNLSDPSEVHGYIADFSFLKNLGTSWDKVRITYTPTYMERYWGDGDPVPANVLAVPIIEEGLAKIAKELVGGEGWAVGDSLTDEGQWGTRWVLNVERRSQAEKTGNLEHVGLHSYLAPCGECNTREEKFRRELDADGMVRFVGESCGAVVTFETPAFAGE